MKESLEDVESKIRWIFLFLILFISMPFIFTASYTSTIDKMSYMFYKTNKPIVCNVKDIKYIINRKDWIFKNHHFVNGKIKIIGMRCEEDK